MKLKRITLLLIFLVLINLLSGYGDFCANPFSGPVIMSLNVCDNENIENLFMEFMPAPPIVIDFLPELFSNTLFVKMAFYKYIPSSLLDRPPALRFSAEG